MIVLDASVLIGFLDITDAHHDTAQSIFVDHLDDTFAIDSLTLAEVLVGPRHTGSLDRALGIFEALAIEELTFSEQTALRLSELRASTGLRMPDCCVLLSAEATGATIATFDVRLARAAKARSLPLLPSYEPVGVG
ncbi:MAG: PIN domain-containing protein [Ornithinimicrobium sp.]